MKPLSKKKIWLFMIPVIVFLAGFIVYSAIYTSAMRQLTAKICGNGKYQVPLNLFENIELNLTYKNRLYHVVGLHNEHDLDEISYYELDQPSFFEKKNIEEQISAYNLKSNRYHYDLQFYGVEGYPTETFLWLIDQDRQIGTLLINESGYSFDSSYELFIEKACLDRFKEVTFYDNNNTIVQTITRGDASQSEKDQIIASLLQEISHSDFLQTTRDNKPGTLTPKHMVFSDTEAGVSLSLVIYPSKEVYLSGLGDTPGVLLSPETYDALMTLFSQP